jgi:predicted RNase H-like HicB family nuclease
VHGRMLVKDHRDTQSRGFAWLLGSFGNFGPCAIHARNQGRSRNQSCQIIGKYASGDAWDAGLVKVFWSDDEGYIAVVPDLPGCSAFGTTPEATVHEIGDAIEAWIAACRASGDPVPEPATKARQAPHA